MAMSKMTASLGQRWSEARPTKTLTFWSCGAAAVATMIVGFTWGGWVTAGTANTMAEALVSTRLAPICVAQFQQDPAKDMKLKGFKETSSWGRSEYVGKQGWATMPGEKEPNGKVSDECAKLLTPMI